MKRRSGRWTSVVLWGGSLLAAAGFAWPLFAAAVPRDAQGAVPFIAFALVPAVIVALALVVDREMYTAKTVALLGVLAAVGAAVRIAGTGVGGVEAVFILLILAGRVYGARFGLLLGLLTIAVSSVLWGGFGPWTPFQMFACGWVGAGAALLPRLGSEGRVGRMGPRAGARVEIAMLACYGVVASYLFGLVMNLWFWPFAVGSGTGISYSPGASLGTNLASFGLYSLVTSTLTWDTVRAVTTVLGICLVGPAALAALRRAKLPGARRDPRPRSTSLPGDGTRRHPSTAPDEVAAPPTARHPSARA
ncbi:MULTISPECIES: ECF transporter S component [unclassified Cryobacterium]|uniref:ECF transporter S component n=1 Tax=unclassified Cryobacterium TaxID=2649013 RepID=UPI002AB5B5CF|nr:MULTISPECIES: ECF transporter S component [unclassified Cryobacterium]MDY7544012.1 ECF transporter S component [Cryobacterium sp. 5B3]MEA9997868.1 ECF transporter S component [Cryobacterium sp. RTS3]MEB0273199.1 ECF transporter S component [Cryobacterium sp. 5B3]